MHFLLTMDNVEYFVPLLRALRLSPSLTIWNWLLWFPNPWLSFDHNSGPQLLLSRCLLTTLFIPNHPPRSLSTLQNTPLSLSQPPSLHLLLLHSVLHFQPTPPLLMLIILIVLPPLLTLSTPHPLLLALILLLLTFYKPFGYSIQAKWERF